MIRFIRTTGEGFDGDYVDMPCGECGLPDRYCECWEDETPEPQSAWCQAPAGLVASRFDRISLLLCAAFIGFICATGGVL